MSQQECSRSTGLLQGYLVHRETEQRGGDDQVARREDVVLLVVRVLVGHAVPASR